MRGLTPFCMGRRLRLFEGGLLRTGGNGRNEEGVLEIGMKERVWDSGGYTNKRDVLRNLQVFYFLALNGRFSFFFFFFKSNCILEMIIQMNKSVSGLIRSCSPVVCRSSRLQLRVGPFSPCDGLHDPNIITPLLCNLFPALSFSLSMEIPCRGLYGSAHLCRASGLSFRNQTR